MSRSCLHVCTGKWKAQNEKYFDHRYLAKTQNKEASIARFILYRWTVENNNLFALVINFWRPSQSDSITIQLARKSPYKSNRGRENNLIEILYVKMVDLPTMFKAVESVMVLICQVNVHRNKTLPSSRERKFFSSPDPIAFTGQERALGTRMLFADLRYFFR